MHCTECGTILSDTAKFCSSCGSRISTSEEATTPEQEQIRVEVSELREVLATTQEDNTRSIVLIGVAFFCLFLIFKPGPLGISMYDWSSVDCWYEWMDGGTYYNDDCASTRSGYQGQVATLGIISLACFYAALKKSESEEDSITESEEDSITEEEQEQEEPEKEAVLPSPLEENKESLKRKKLVEKWTVPVVLIICAYSISLLFTPTEITGLHEIEVWRSGYTTAGDVLMMNAIEALDVNNCLDKAYDNGGDTTPGIMWSQVQCPMVADSANETIRKSVAIMLLANIIGYFVLKKSKEQISNIQDSITEMEEE